MASNFDVYGMTDRIEDDVADVIVKRLEARGKQEQFQRMMDDYLVAMNIDAAGKVLDLGCGTGVAARAIARRGHFAGHVTGIDLSPRFIEVARRLCAEEGVAERIDFRVGDTRSLEIPDAAFDAVVAHTLLSHVDAPAQVLAEIARSVKPGGLVGIFDGDYASMTFSNVDAPTAQRYEDAIQEAIISNPRIMRDMPRLLRAAGLELVRTFGYVVADIGRVDFWLPAIESFRRLLPRAGAMSGEAAAAWADERLKESDMGIFFGASNFYGYVARRPG